MKKTHILSAFLMISATTFSIALAQGYGVTNVNSKTKTQGNATSALEKSDDRGNATSSEKRNNHSTSTATSTATSTVGQLTAESHRSIVASFVQSLLNVANREGGIGDQVREIARSQNDSSTTTASAITTIEQRNNLKTFFFGSDYKNLGVIRSGLATTTNNIEKLKSLLDKTTNVVDRNEISAQIQTLETELTKLNTYVTTHENTFSLFGWFTKLFVK